jgi:hypothetical protein
VGYYEKISLIEDDLPVITWEQAPVFLRMWIRSYMICINLCPIIRSIDFFIGLVFRFDVPGTRISVLGSLAMAEHG